MTEHATNVVKIVVQPKTIGMKYRKLSLVIKYAPADKRWHWEVTYQPPKRVFRGDNATQAIALSKARAKIDWLLDGD